MLILIGFYSLRQSRMTVPHADPTTTPAHVFIVNYTSQIDRVLETQRVVPKHVSVFGDLLSSKCEVVVWSPPLLGEAALFTFIYLLACIRTVYFLAWYNICFVRFRNKVIKPSDQCSPSIRTILQTQLSVFNPNFKVSSNENESTRLLS